MQRLRLWPHSGLGLGRGVGGSGFPEADKEGDWSSSLGLRVVCAFGAGT